MFIITLALLQLAGCGTPQLATAPVLPSARIALVPSATPAPWPTRAATATLLPLPTLPAPTATPPPVPADPQAPLDAAVVEAQIFTLINQLRADNGMPPLAHSLALSAAARAHSCDLAAHDTISHISSDGRRLLERLPASVPPWEWPSENIAVGYSDAATVVTAWFDEAPPDDWHRRNILAGDQRELGVGYCYDGGGSPGNRHYYTADFARRSGLYPLVLADGSGATNTREVPYWLYGAGWAEAMRLGSSRDLSGLPWQPFQQHGVYKLAPLAGPQTVYAELRGPGGTQMVSATVRLK